MVATRKDIRESDSVVREIRERNEEKRDEDEEGLTLWINKNTTFISL